MTRLPRRRFGLSLVELLVVIALIGVLLSLILSAVQGARGAAARVSCQNNLRQVALAAHGHHTSTGHLPAGYERTQLPTGRSAWITWAVALLPHLEQNDLYTSARLAYGTDYGFRAPPHTGLSAVVKAYTCPADGRLSAPLTDADGTVAYGSFLGVVGVAADPGPGGTPLMPPERYGVIMPVIPGLFGRVRFADITDGQSQTVMFGERPPPGRRFAGNWYTIDVPPEYGEQDDGLFHGPAMPAYSATNTNRCRGPFKLGPGRIENPCDSFHFWSLHPGGANFAFADGSVRFLAYSAAPLLPALATRAGGESVSLD